MRKIIVSAIIATAIVTSMSPAALAATDHVRHRHAQATEATRNAYGSAYQEREPAFAPWSAPVYAGNRTVQPDDPRTAVNGN
jgi:hypothetical protein